MEEIFDDAYRKLSARLNASMIANHFSDTTTSIMKAPDLTINSLCESVQKMKTRSSLPRRIEMNEQSLRNLARQANLAQPVKTRYIYRPSSVFGVPIAIDDSLPYGTIKIIKERTNMSPTITPTKTVKKNVKLIETYPGLKVTVRPATTTFLGADSEDVMYEVIHEENKKGLKFYLNKHKSVLDSTEFLDQVKTLFVEKQTRYNCEAVITLKDGQKEEFTAKNVLDTRFNIKVPEGTTNVSFVATEVK